GVLRSGSALPFGGAGDPDRFTGIAGKAGEHRLDQVRDQFGEGVGARACLGKPFEQGLAVGGAAYVDVQEAGIDGVGVDVVAATAERAVQERIVPAPVEGRVVTAEIAEPAIIWAVAEA